MQKKGIFILAFILFGSLIYGQTVTRQVLVPLASAFSNGGFNVSQTVGEPVVDYVRTYELELTQGFQQPSLTENTNEETNKGYGVKVYPNPVKDNLYIEMFGTSSSVYELSLYGLNGALYHKIDYSCVGEFRDIETLNLRSYKRGSYILRISTKDGLISRVFKIQKL